MDRLVIAADADVHGPRQRPATSHEDGVWRKRADKLVSGLKTCVFKGFPDYHEHGMDRDLHLDDVRRA
jgi:hypothetical protein